jgi:hypothetical protein
MVAAFHYRVRSVHGNHDPNSPSRKDRFVRNFVTKLYRLFLSLSRGDLGTEELKGGGSDAPRYVPAPMRSGAAPTSDSRSAAFGGSGYLHS